MNHVKQIVKLAGTILLFGLLAGCVTTAPPIKERYFWPPPPDTPRIEWLGVYQNELDIKPANNFLEMLTGGEEQGGLQRPTYIAANGKGKVIVSDYKQGMMVFDSVAQNVHILGSQKSSGLLELPSGITFDGEGNIYAGDARSRKIFIFDKQENLKSVVDLSKELSTIASIAVDKTRKHLIVPDMKGHLVLIYDLESRSIIKTIGKPIPGDKESETVTFNYPTSAAVDAKGNFWICDSMNARIVQFSPEGKFISAFGNRGDGVGDFNLIKAVAVDSEGHIYVTDGKANRVSIHDEKGTSLLVFGGTYSFAGAGSKIMPGGFLLPNGIFIDQNDTIYIVDAMNNRYQVYQYVTEKYLKEHPITNEAPAAKPVVSDAPDGKNKLYVPPSQPPPAGGRSL